MTATATQAPAAATIPDLSPEALDILTTRLTRATGRHDVEVLAITGVRSQWADTWCGGHPGVGIDVVFTYTSGRRQRRTRTLAWPVGKWTRPGDRNENLPPALWAFLTAAVAAHGTPA
jgi:hypothetical protein